MPQTKIIKGEMAMKTKTRPRLASIMAVLTAGSALLGMTGAAPSAAAASGKVIDLNSESCYQNRSEAAIRSKYAASIPADMSAALYSDSGSNTGGKYRAAVMTSETKQNVLKLTNYYRWLAGLSTFTYTTDQTIFDNDAKGAVLLSASNFSHTPDKPADMSQSFYNAAKSATSTSSIAKTNGATGQAAILRTMRLWLNDDAYTNPGHRNMFFTRNGQKLGYGMFTDSKDLTCSVQTIQYVGLANPSGTSELGNDATAYTWPAPGNFPAEELSSKAWWTVTLNTDKAYYSDLSKVTVKIKDTDSGTVYTRTAAAETLNDTKYWGRTLSFSPPDNGADGYLGKNYTVTVQNLSSAGYASSTTLQYSIHFMSYTALTNLSYLSQTVITENDSAKICGKAEGGTGGYTYQFSYRKVGDSAWTSLEATSCYQFKNLPAGDYQVRVIVKDSSGASKTSTLTNTSSLSSYSIKMGQSVTMTGSAAGGTGEYQYQYEYKLKSDSGYTLLKAFSSAGAYVFTPPQADSYSLKITVKSTYSSYSASSSRIFSLNVSPSGDSLANASSLKQSTVNLGDSVQINSVASGGSGGYRYSYYYKKTTSSNYTALSENNKSAIYVFKPGSSASYQVKVVVKDSAGATAVKILNLRVNATLKNTSTISASSVKKGSSVTLTGKATGGSGAYTYAYYYKKSTSSTWQLLKDFSTSNKATCKPASAATYSVKVVAKDSTNHKSAKIFTLKVTA